MVNLHVHTWRCRHATGTAVEMAVAAHRAGVSILGFAEHGPLPVELDDWRLDITEFPAYVAEVEEARARFPDMTILLGLEADYIPEYADFVREFASQDVFDYVIGSVHYIGGWNFDHEDLVDEWDSRDPIEVYRTYLGLVREAARLGAFQIIGHLDLPKKFGHRMPEAVWPDLEETLRVIREEGLAIELNTAGLRGVAGEPYPSERILRRAIELGIPIALGSDAHRPEDVTAGLRWASARLRALGADRIVSFQQRKQVSVPLAEMVQEE